MVRRKVYKIRPEIGIKKIARNKIGDIWPKTGQYKW
jgi:hypothetical protein